MSKANKGLDLLWAKQHHFPPSHETGDIAEVRKDIAYVLGDLMALNLGGPRFSTVIGGTSPATELDADDTGFTVSINGAEAVTITISSPASLTAPEEIVEEVNKLFAASTDTEVNKLKMFYLNVLDYEQFGISYMDFAGATLTLAEIGAGTFLADTKLGDDATAIPYKATEDGYFPTNLLFVSNDGDDDFGTGTESNPFLTLEAALDVARTAATDDYTICVVGDATGYTIALTGADTLDFGVTILGFAETKPVLTGDVRITDAGVKLVNLNIVGQIVATAAFTAHDVRVDGTVDIEGDFTAGRPELLNVEIVNETVAATAALHYNDTAADPTAGMAWWSGVKVTNGEIEAAPVAADAVHLEGGFIRIENFQATHVSNTYAACRIDGGYAYISDALLSNVELGVGLYDALVIDTSNIEFAHVLSNVTCIGNRSFNKSRVVLDACPQPVLLSTDTGQNVNRYGNSGVAGMVRLTFADQPADADTITLTDGEGAVIYEFDTGDGVAEGHVTVLIGGTLPDTLDNLVAAIHGQAQLVQAIEDGATIVDIVDTITEVDGPFNFGAKGTMTVTKSCANLTITSVASYTVGQAPTHRFSSVKIPVTATEAGAVVAFVVPFAASYVDFSTYTASNAKKADTTTTATIDAKTWYSVILMDLQGAANTDYVIVNVYG